MKKILLLLLAASITVVSFSQEEKEKKAVTPPAAAKTSFEKKFTGATKTKWTKEDADFEVSFVKDGKEMSAVYDAKGTLKETETEIKVSELPKAVTDYIKANYKGAKITEATKIVKANEEVNYEAEIKDKALVFDANGKFIKEEKD